MVEKILDSEVVAKSITLIDICNLYHDFQNEKRSMGIFARLKREGLCRNLDEVKKRVSSLIKTSQEYGLSEYKDFKSSIETLKKTYEL